MPPLSLAVDVEGGDFGLPTLLQGVLEAKKRCTVPTVIHLCGRKTLIKKALVKRGSVDLLAKGELRIEHCDQTIDPDHIPLQAWKKFENSSTIRCISLQKEGCVQASVSAGDTRLLVGGSVFILGRQEHMPRPALAAFFPTVTHQPTLLLDMGATINARPEHLASFGIMGYDYLKKFRFKDNPSVALLNIGRESSKGTRIIKDAGEILKDKCQGYRGFIEGAQIFSGTTDVVVCDGFTGNILLKAIENFYMLIESIIKKNSNISIDVIKEKITVLNPENYGAALLLGLKGLVFKAHGSSSSQRIANAVLDAIRVLEQSNKNHQPHPLS